MISLKFYSTLRINCWNFLWFVKTNPLGSQKIPPLILNGKAKLSQYRHFQNVSEMCQKRK